MKKILLLLISFSTLLFSMSQEEIRIEANTINAMCPLKMTDELYIEKVLPGKTSLIYKVRNIDQKVDEMVDFNELKDDLIKETLTNVCNNPMINFIPKTAIYRYDISGKNGKLWGSYNVAIKNCSDTNSIKMNKIIAESDFKKFKESWKEEITSSNNTVDMLARISKFFYPTYFKVFSQKEALQQAENSLANLEKRGIKHNYISATIESDEVLTYVDGYFTFFEATYKIHQTINNAQLKDLEKMAEIMNIQDPKSRAKVIKEKMAIELNSSEMLMAIKETNKDWKVVPAYTFSSMKVIETVLKPSLIKVLKEKGII